MDISLAHTETGTGNPLIILHGLFGSGRNWTGIARSLGHAWRVITPDLRNHGASPWLTEMSYDAMADDVRQLMRDLGIASGCVIGHSMGGKVAMTLALRSPGLVERLVVADIAPLAYKPVLRAYADAMQAIDPSSLPSRQAADDALSAAIHEPAIRGFLLQNLVRDEGAWRWRINLKILSSAMEVICGTSGMDGAPPFNGPALFLRGARSDYVPDAAEPAIRELFPKADIATIADAGHWLHAEQPRAFVEAVSTWLEMPRS